MAETIREINSQPQQRSKGHSRQEIMDSGNVQVV
jgi:hypothetical protein